MFNFSSSTPAAKPGAAPNWPARLFIAALLLLAFGLLIQPLGDPDIFIHLRDGRYLLEHRFQVTTEPFSYTASQKPFETVEWLFRTGLYLTWQAGGYNLMIVIKAVLMTAALFLLGGLVYRRWRNLGMTALLLGLGVLAPATRLFPERPYVFTYLLLPVVLLLLEKLRRASAQEEPAARRSLWLIPALVVPWTNLHPGFMVLFGFLGAQMAQDGLDAWLTRDPRAGHRFRTLGLIFIASLLAGAVNPMGFGLYTFSLEMMNSKEFLRFITEWAPPTLSGEPFFFALLGGAWLALLLNWRGVKLYDLLPLAAFSYMAVKSYRNIPLFVIAALPILAGNLAALKQRFFPHREMNPAQRKQGLLVGCAATVLLLAFASSAGWAFRLGELPRFYPQDGLAWLQRQPFQGRLLTHDIWGGFTGWATHGKTKVFMDGRLPTFGERLYADYRRMIWGDPELCLPLLQRYQIEGVLVSPKNDLKLFQQLWASREWALVYWDDVCLLYLRRTEANATLIGRYGYQAVDPKRTPYFNPNRPDLALLEVLRAKDLAPRSFLPRFFEGDLHLRFSRLAESRKALQSALNLAPGHAASYLNLGLIAQRENRPEEAERLFHRVLDLEAEPILTALACYQLSTLMTQDPLRRNQALVWAQRAVKAAPEWEQSRKLLAELSR